MFLDQFQLEYENELTFSLTAFAMFDSLLLAIVFGVTVDSGKITTWFKMVLSLLLTLFSTLVARRRHRLDVI